MVLSTVQRLHCISLVNLHSQFLSILYFFLDLQYLPILTVRSRWPCFLFSSFTENSLKRTLTVRVAESPPYFHLCPTFCCVNQGAHDLRKVKPSVCALNPTFSHLLINCPSSSALSSCIKVSLSARLFPAPYRSVTSSLTNSSNVASPQASLSPIPSPVPTPISFASTFYRTRWNRFVLPKAEQVKKAKMLRSAARRGFIQNKLVKWEGKRKPQVRLPGGEGYSLRERWWGLRR